MSFHLDWLFAVVFTGLILSFIFLIKKSRGRWFFLIRALIILILIWLVLGPSTVKTPSSGVKPFLSIMLDTSRSMGIKDTAGRLENAKNILGAAEQLFRKKFERAYYSFSDHSSRIAEGKINQLKPLGPRTNLYESIRQVFEEQNSKQDALILFSDGSHNGSDGKESLPLFSAPVFTVGMGSENNIYDLALKDLRGSDFAFKGKPLEISVRLENRGYKNKTVPVRLKEKTDNNLREISVQDVFLKDSGSVSELQFRVTPNRAGENEYQIEVPAGEEEIARQNNGIQFKTTVLRERIRILYLCGAPSPEYSFLRQLLKSDPSIDLVSFVILRNPENVVPVSEDQLSLIPFPTHTIFGPSLSQFDLVIFENFASNRFGLTSEHLENIRRFVEEGGGGFLMIGGENSFGLGNYRGTSLEKILPVEMDVFKERIEEESFTVRALELGHPLLALGDSVAKTEELWKELPPMNGYHWLPGIKAGASLLAAVPETGAPAMVSWQKGKGRVLAFAGFSSWQWALKLSAKGRTEDYYARFWRQAVRWLTSSGSPNPVRIGFQKPRWVTGESGAIRILLERERIKSKNPEIQLNVLDLNGRVFQSLTPTAVSNTEYQAEWNPEKNGKFTVSAVVRDGSASYSDTKPLEVETYDFELENPAPNHELLKKISEQSGGEYYDAKNFSPETILGKIKKRRELSPQVPIQKDLSSSAWLLGFAAGLLILDWALRRFRGEI